ncbi:hypothetical protein CMV30_16865 [Nibricoccus aquaticus]|uniref:Uncharacterized protein n=1 Tax=Nibricoccus aquaticus TaxID=2576891 RepID=A0A290QLU6_9BACT|nr:hypothetical protein [Nibricoccus aquaticus]ATC65481.1 hypothetical protein CMV30_16865 [Nibricoccus aquaticus]
MSAARIFIPVIALLIGGWFVFDGTRALTVGDFLTAKTGPRSGQLGPWSLLVAKAGINPRGTLIKSVHLALGLLWLTGLVLFFLRPDLGRWVLLTSSVCSLWYLPLGTVLAIIEMALLLVPIVRTPK